MDEVKGLINPESLIEKKADCVIRNISIQNSLLILLKRTDYDNKS